MVARQTGGRPRCRPAPCWPRRRCYDTERARCRAVEARIINRTAMITAIDGTPAVRPILTGTEVYARSIIEALAGARANRAMRVYANAIAPPAWLPPGVEWRGIPFP